MERKESTLTREKCKSFKGSDINTNFFFLNAHGVEKKDLFEIPKGVRVIMFCYSKVLDVCKRFDRFNWEHILLDSGASKNYCNFLSTISQYSSIRDHFCIYEENDVMHNIDIYTDENFREGLYRLPVKGYAFDDKNQNVVVSDKTLISDIDNTIDLKKLFKKAPNTNIKVDSKRVGELLRKKNNVGIIKSFVRKIGDKARLSNLIKSLQLNVPNFTILLMVCREKDHYFDNDPKISEGRIVIDEVQNMERYLELENILKNNN